MIQRHELEQALRLCGPLLQHCTVEPASEFVSIDHLVFIKAVVFVHGLPYPYEAGPINMRALGSAEDIVRLAKEIHAAILAGVSEIERGSAQFTKELH